MGLARALPLLALLNVLRHALQLAHRQVELGKLLDADAQQRRVHIARLEPERPPAKEHQPEGGGTPAIVPRGSEAVRLVLRDAGTPTGVGELIADMRRRGWANEDAKHPEAAIRAALQRLVHAGEAERAGTGVYVYAPRAPEVSPDREAGP